MADVSIWLAFGAGVLSFISPCCLPLYPSYISYITGVSISQLQDANQPRQLKRATMFHTSFFILGFSIIFFALGFSASWVGSFFSEYRDLIRMLGGVLIAVMGLFMLGLIKPGFMMKEKRLEVGRKRWGYLGSSVIGMAFAAGWTPVSARFWCRCWRWPLPILQPGSPTSPLTHLDLPFPFSSWHSSWGVPGGS